ncbi:MAG: riboflavin biosynthesis protein RibF [Prevotellaceae bacterium]|jgi:riboflavin kinase/FMN adenylyltransferase|nr:riboflavin biosynthesis protein RibF [Prevotellaceae bacterium]
MVATTGFFDGVHLGHRAVLQRVAERARAQGSASAVVTFWPHPRVILHRDAQKVRLLNALDEKQQRLRACGIDHIHVLPFTPAFAALSPEAFMREYLCGQFHISTLVVGYDHHLGRDAGAGYDRLRAIGRTTGIAVEQVPQAYVADGEAGAQAVSSTKIREALAGGAIATANRLLGYAYSLRGVVVEGQHLGRRLGFPTANMQLYEPLKQLPANGVYATRVRLYDAVFMGMTNIGYRPTVQPSGAARTVETHILDFCDDIYGQDFTLEFLDRIREERQFASLDALTAQLKADREEITNYELRITESGYRRI